MADLFISYSRKDKPFVIKLHAELTRLERDVWVDWEDIPPSADWWAEIREGIEEADYFVFIISPDSIISDVCAREIEHAEIYNKRIIPVLRRDITDEDIKSQIPATIGTHNWIFFRDGDNFDEAIKTIMSALETDLAYVRQHTQLSVQARDWVNSKKNNSFLIDGDQINIAEQWLSSAYGKTPEPTELQIEFITTSRKNERQRQARIFGAAVIALIIAVALAIFGFIQSSRASSALAESEQRGTQVALEVTNVAAAQNTSEFNYSQAQTQQVIAQNQANIAQTQEARAQNLLVTSEFQGEQIALEVTNVAAAQSTAEFNYNQALTQEARAQNLLVTSEFQGEQIALEVTNVAAAQSTAEFNAGAAQTQQVIAEFQANVAQTQEARAQNLLVTSEFQGEQIALEVTNVAAAQNTAEFNAFAAQTQQAIAQFQANVALTQEARSQNLLVTSEYQGEQIALEVTNVAAAQNTAEFNAAIAQTQEARSQNLLVTSEFQGEQIALEVTNVAAAQNTSEFNYNQALTQEARAQELLLTSEFQGAQIALEVTNVAAAQNTAEFNAANAQTQEARAQNLLVTSEFQGEQIGIEATRVSIAQATSVYNEQQALAQSLAVNAELAMGTGNYDLAFALALEAFNEQPDLTQAQRVLNQIVYSSARLSFDDNRIAEFAPGGEHILISDGFELLLINIENAEVVVEYDDEHNGQILDAALSNDGNYMVSSDDRGVVIFWDTWDGTVINRFEHDAPVHAVAINNNASNILSGDDNSTVIRWDARGGTPLFTYTNVASRPIRRLRFSPDQNNFFVWSDSDPDGQRFMGLWSLSSGTRRYEIDDRDSAQEAFIGISDRTGYAYGNGTRPVIIYESATYTEIRRLGEIRINFNQLNAGARAFNNSGNRLIVSFDDIERRTGNVKIYDIATGDLIQELENLDEQIVGAVALSPSEDFALTADENQLVLWNMDSGREIQRLSAHNDDIIEITFNAAGNYALSRDRSNNVRVWDINASDISEVGRTRIRTEIPNILFLGFNSDSTRVITGLITSVLGHSIEPLEQADRIDPGAVILNLKNNPVAPETLIVMEESIRIANSNDLPVRIRTIFTESFENFTGEAAYSPDGSLIAYGASNRIYVAQNSGDFNVISEIDKSVFIDFLPYEIIDIEIASDNQTLAVLFEPLDDISQIFIIDILTGEVLLEFDEYHRREITDIDIHPDGMRLASASLDNDIYIWDLETGLILQRLVGHNRPVNAIQFTPSGNELISVSDDTAIILWDLSASQELRRFVGHVRPIKLLNVSPNGQYAVTSAGNEEMFVWEISGDEDVVTWAFDNRFIPELSCIERLQYNVQPLCEEIESIDDDYDDDFDDYGEDDDDDDFDDDDLDN